MNKRKYPYGTDMCPQLKVHIGDKQIVNGVLGPSKMSEIYDKTKQLLFQRVKASFVPIIQPIEVDQTPSDIKPFRQLQLTSNGKLLKPEIFIKNSKKLYDNIQKCNYCCQTGKLEICGKCGDMYCNMCSLNLCSDEVNQICLTCYK